MTPIMHHCLVFRVHVLWMSGLYVVRVAALWMLRVQLRPYVRQIWMQTLHFHFGCKVERPPEEQQEAPVCSSEACNSALWMHGPAWDALRTSSATRGVSNALLLHGLI